MEIKIGQNWSGNFRKNKFLIVFLRVTFYAKQEFCKSNTIRISSITLLNFYIDIKY